MISPLRFLLLLLLVLCLLFRFSSSESPGLVGVTYRPHFPWQPETSLVSQMLKEMGVPRVRLIDPRPEDVEAFADTGIIINLSVKFKPDILYLAANKSTAVDWVKKYLSPNVDKVNITTVSLGYNILVHSPELTNTLLIALKYFRAACTDLGFHNIAVTTSHSFKSVVGVATPSSAVFTTAVRPHMARVLDFLNTSRVPFEVELYPFSIHKAGLVPGATLKFAMFEVDNSGMETIVDEATGYRYWSLYDMMFDSVANALRQAGYGEMPIEVVGTGWPGWSDKYEMDVNVGYLGEFNDRLMSMVNERRTTPTYIHSLYDEHQDKDEDDEPFKPFMGIFHDDNSKKYAVSWDNDDDESKSSAATSPEAAGAVFFLSSCLLLSLFVQLD